MSATESIITEFHFARIVRESQKAVCLLFRRKEGHSERTVWIPKSQIRQILYKHMNGELTTEVIPGADILEVELPEWLTVEKGF